MSNGEVLEEIRRVLKEETEVPTKVSQRLIVAALVEVYRKLNTVEDLVEEVKHQQDNVDNCLAKFDLRLIGVENRIEDLHNNGNGRGENRTKDLKWALEKVGLPVFTLILGIILAHIFGG